MKDGNGRTIILGAGLAGLSAAYHGGGSVYEGSDRYGGTCISPRVNGYTFDLGIHVLHTRNEYVIGLLRDILKIDLVDRKRSARLYSFDRLTRYPIQANTFGLPLPIVKDCLVSFIETYCERKKNRKQMCDNYEKWLVAAFGRGIAEHFMIPYSEKFWTVHPRNMTTDWLDVRIPMPALHEVVEGALTDQTREFGPNAIFRYPLRNGISAIPGAFVKNGVKVILNKKAVKIDIKKKEIEFADGTRQNYDVLISTIPLPELVDIANVPATVSQAARRLKYNSILCVNLGIDKANINTNHWIYYPEKKYSFFRISFLKNFSSTMAPGARSSITAEIAYSRKKKIDRDEIVDDVIKDLVSAKILTKKDKVELVDIRDIPYGYVIYNRERAGNLRKIRSFFRKNAVVLAGRYGNWEYQWMDDAILDGKRAAGEAADRYLSDKGGSVKK